MWNFWAPISTDLVNFFDMILIVFLKLAPKARFRKYARSAENAPIIDFLILGEVGVGVRIFADSKKKDKLKGQTQPGRNSTGMVCCYLCQFVRSEKVKNGSPPSFVNVHPRFCMETTENSLEISAIVHCKGPRQVPPPKENLGSMQHNNWLPKALGEPNWQSFR